MIHSMVDVMECHLRKERRNQKLTLSEKPGEGDWLYKVLEMSTEEEFGVPKLMKKKKKKQCDAMARQR